MKMAELNPGYSKLLKSSKNQTSTDFNKVTLPSVNKDIDISDIKINSETIGNVTKTWHKNDDKHNIKSSNPSRLNRESTEDES